MTRPLALFGGTFDPVHVGHLRVAWEAAEALDADVRLVPANVPPHRPQPVASAAQRLALLERALAGQSRLVADDRELRRDGPSWTIDTLVDLRAALGAAQPLVLLVGADAWAGLPTWRRWRELFEVAHLGVLTRAGQRAVESDELAHEAASRRVADPRALHATPSGHVVDIAVSALDVSATRIRAELAAGREPRWLVAEALLADPALLAPYRTSGA